MSNLLNSLVIALNGGKGSGFFNPEHAAWSASQSVHLNNGIYQGEGKHLIYGIVNNYAILESLKQSDKSWDFDYTDEPTPEYKIIEEEGKKQKGISCLLKREVGTKQYTDVTDYKESDKKATNLIYQVASMHKEIANELSKLAMVERAESYTGDSKRQTRKWLNTANRFVKQSQHYSVGLLDSDGNYTPILQALTNTQNSLQEYWNSLKNIKG